MTWHRWTIEGGTSFAVIFGDAFAEEELNRGKPPTEVIMPQICRHTKNSSQAVEKFPSGFFSPVHGQSAPNIPRI